MPRTAPRLSRPLIEPTFSVDAQNGAPLDAEWLLTNGTGAFAMGTAAGCNTRRYHGLLIAATRPPVERINTVNAVDEILRFDGQSRELATHEFGDGGPTVLHPQGWHHLLRFERTATMATWHYRVGSILLTKTLRLMWKRQLAALSYETKFDPARKPRDSHPWALDEPAPDRVTLLLRPLLAMRDFHGLRSAHSDPPFDLSGNGRTLRIGCGNVGTLHMAADRGRFVNAGDWWYNFHYRREAERGLDYKESLYTPGNFEFTFDGSQPQTMTLMFGIEPIEWSARGGLDSHDRDEHFRGLVDHVCRTPLPSRQGLGRVGRGTTANDNHLVALTLASDDFVVDRRITPPLPSRSQIRRGGERAGVRVGRSATATDPTAGQPYLSTTIIAGYPWFSDWGRDTMIALPGCLLATGRFEDAKRTLGTFAAHIKDGLIPNRFDDYGGDPHYNTVDGSLWFIHACVQYLTASGDKQTWKEQLAPACMSIIEAFQRGTHYDIRMDSDGLVTAGSPDTQLTWMDAARDGVVFTPRWGKAVEINSLWLNALLSVAPHVNSKTAADLKKLADNAKSSFVKTFWSDDLGYLLDHVNPYGKDTTLRPNQLFAVSLPHSPLPQARQKQVLGVLRDRLLTPMGLRTLPQGDSNYHPHYTGSMFERDRAYHQGTVWPWLMGPFVEGWLRANKFAKSSRDEARQFIQPLLNQLTGPGLGQLHEIFDADPPHSPAGCPAQAWSVAETLRAYLLIESENQN